MTVLNGLGAEEIVREHGDWPLVSAVTFMSGTRHSDTHVEYILDTETWLGPYESTPFERVQEIADLIVASGLKAEALPDLRPAQWSKLIFNAAVNPVAALTRPPARSALRAGGRSPTGLGHLVHGLVDEGKAVAAAAGIELHDDPWEMNVLATQRGSAHYPSMLEDVEAREADGDRPHHRLDRPRGGAARRRRPALEGGARAGERQGGLVVSVPSLARALGRQRSTRRRG